jgi:amidase
MSSIEASGGAAKGTSPFSEDTMKMTRRTLLTAGAACALRAATSSFKPGFATAQESAEAVRLGKISATELVNDAFHRIDLYNPKLNAIILEFREQATARARQADEALSHGRRWGPLHGVPVTVKEAFAYTGSPNTWGLNRFKDLKSGRTAIAVERLESAGAIVIGKTNIPVGLADYQTYNPIYGTTNNPWDLARTPGGSTGGGAAAVAAGLGPLTLGSDLAGSIRVPAHFCGIYGHKPTINLINYAGHVPGPWNGGPARTFDLAVAGPLARSATDLGFAMSVLGGPAGEEASAWTWHMPPPRHQRLKDFRIGYMLEDSTAPISEELAQLHENLITQLGRSGARLTSGWPAGIDPGAEWRTFEYVLASGLSGNPSEEQLATLRWRLETNPDDLTAAVAVNPHSRWVAQTLRQLNSRTLWQQYFQSHDVFLLPAAFCVAFPHDHSMPAENRRVETSNGKQSMDGMRYWSAFATLPGLPATVAPIGKTPGGLPGGIQIVAPMWEDGTAIEFAALLADLVGGYTAPPGYGI